jgi:hypothetical protein
MTSNITFKDNTKNILDIAGYDITAIEQELIIDEKYDSQSKVFCGMVAYANSIQ